MFKELNLIHGSDEWLEYRRSHVTATDTPILLEQMVRYGKTPLSLYNAKMNGLKEFENDSMKRGTELEPFARSKVSTILNVDFEPKIVESVEYPYLMASLDAIDKDYKTLVEIKCPGANGITKASRGDIEDYWNTQCQTQMFILGLDIMYVFVYQDEYTHYLIKVEADKKIQNKIIREAKIFFDCIVNMTEPALLEKDYLVIEDEESNEIAALWIIEDEKAKRQKEIADGLKKQLIDRTDDGNCVFSKAGVRVTRSSGRTTINWKMIQKELNISEEFIKKYENKGIGYPIVSLIKKKDINE